MKAQAARSSRRRRRRPRRRRRQEGRRPRPRRRRRRPRPPKAAPARRPHRPSAAHAKAAATKAPPPKARAGRAVAPSPRPRRRRPRRPKAAAPAPRAPRPSPERRADGAVAAAPPAPGARARRRGGPRRRPPRAPRRGRPEPARPSTCTAPEATRAPFRGRARRSRPATRRAAADWRRRPSRADRAGRRRRRRPARTTAPPRRRADGRPPAPARLRAHPAAPRHLSVGAAPGPPSVDDAAPRRARRRASTSSRWPRPSRSSRCGRRSRRRKAAGLHGGMAFTYRQPGPVHRPGRGAAGRRGAGRRRPQLPRRRAGAGRPASPAGAIARYAWDDHYAAPAGRARRPWRRVLQGATGGGPACWSTTTPSSTGPPPTGPASAGGARTPTCCCPGSGSWYVLGSVVTDAPLPRRRRRRSPTGAARARRCLDGCPTGAITAPGRRRRPPLPVVAAPGRGRRSRSSTAWRSGDRIYGCDECQEVCPPNRRAPVRAADRARSGRGRRCSTCSTTTTPWCSSGPSAGTSRSARSALRPPQRARSCSATSATARDPAWSRCSSATCATPTRCCGPRRLGGAPPRTRGSARAARAEADPPRSLDGARRLRSDDPPLRHQRLPAQDRRDPDDALGAVAPARPVVVRRCSPPRTRTPRRGTPSSRSASCAPASRCCCPRPALRRRIDALAGGDRCRPASCSTRRCPSGCSARGSGAPVRVVLHGAEVTVPGRLPVADQLLGRVLRGAELVVIAPAATRWPRPTRAAGRPLPERARAARGRHRPVPPARRRPSGAAPRARLGLPVDGPLVVSVSRLVPRKGMDVLIRAAAPAGARRTRTCASPSAAAGATAAASSGSSRRTGAPVRLLGRVAHDDLPAALRLRRRVRHAVPQPLGRARAGGLRHRVPRGRRGRRPAGGGRQRRRGRGRGRRRDRASWCDDPRDPDAVARAPRPAARRPRRCGPAWPTPGGERAVAELSYDVLAARLGAALAAWEAGAAWLTVRRAAPGRRPRQPGVRRHRRARGHEPRGGARCPTPSASCTPSSSGAALRGRHRRAAVGLRPRRVAQPHRRGHARRACSSSPAARRRPTTRRRFRIALAVEVRRRGGRRARSGPYTEVAFGVLAPMFGLGLMAMWGGRYGSFPARRRRAVDRRRDPAALAGPARPRVPGGRWPCSTAGSAPRSTSWTGPTTARPGSAGCSSPSSPCPILLGLRDRARLLLRRRPPELARLAWPERSVTDQNAPDGRPGDADHRDRRVRRARSSRSCSTSTPTPRWARDLKGVTVESRDDEGRGQRGHLPGRGHGPQHELHAALLLRRRAPPHDLGARAGRHHAPHRRQLHARAGRRATPTARTSPTTSPST